MRQYDESRLADIRMLERKLNDPNTPPYEKSKIDNALYAIRAQSTSKPIQKLRELMKSAVKNGDRDLAERLAAKAKRIDRDWF